ncbi:MoaD/ThiS family protein [Aestuariimicrobium ganziense]|uniref:MoaD/ThiS family protein n=1 Tax=Aestuariimicrobium ganziense TaxID=2773677 RepID=UPI0019452241|nr:MoaD/ThiS family protein [Aestuariimicrobium ganziense]
MIVRFFAGAAAAAGVDQRSIELADDATFADLESQLADGNEHLAKVLRVSALLADGVRVINRGQAVADTAQVDVLPPFAGG